MKIDEIEKNYQRWNGQLKHHIKRSAEVNEELSTIKRKHEAYIKANELFKTAVEMSQGNVKTIIETLVTMAIRAIYTRNFSYRLIFKQTKNTFTCRPQIVEDEVEYNDIDEDLGGGIVDVISFAQKIVFWSIERTRNILIFDEPFKNLGVLSSRAFEMVKKLSRDLKLQFIITTHMEELMDGDKIFMFEHDGSKSIVTEE
jgi:DNA repair exonuclease SbcCD ATPase subunit